MREKVGRDRCSMKIPHIKLANPFKGRRLSSTGTTASALTQRPMVSPGQGQGSGTLQKSESISYSSVPLAYIHSPTPHKANVGKPLSQRLGFSPPTQQHSRPHPNAKVKR